MEQSIDELDEDYARVRGERLEVLHDLRRRAKEREEKLASISREAAEEFRAPPTDGGGNEPLREAIGTIDGPVRDAMADALAQAAEGTPLHTRLKGALEALSNLSGLVVEASRPRWADVYDLAHGDDNEHWGSQGYGENWGDEAGIRDGWGPRGHSDTPAWAKPSEAGNADGAEPMDMGDVQVPSWMRDGTTADGDDPWGIRAWKRGRRWHHDDGGTQGRHAAADELTRDHEEAARLQAHQNDAIAAAGAAAAPATPPPVDAALEQRKQEAAQEQDIAVSCAQIADMGAATLEEWAAANLI